MKLKNSGFLVFFLVFFFNLTARCDVSAQTIPERVPPGYQDKYDKINQWLDEKIIEWKPSKFNNISFCAHHLPASEQMVNLSDGSFDLPFLLMLKETGIDCVRLSIFPDNYEKYRDRYDILIAKIRENNLKLMVAYMVGGDSAGGTFTSFEQYKKKELEFTKMFIKKYSPQYYAVVTEPITMEKRIRLSEKLSAGQWIGLVNEVTSLIKKMDPAVKTIAAVNTEPGQLELAKNFSGVENLDIIAFQLYGPAGLSEEYKGWVGKGDVVGEAIDHVEKRGLDTWITETWLSIPTVETWQGSKDSNICFNEPFMASLDAKWLKVITYYAAKHKVKGISPFFTGKFISYPSSDRSQQSRNFLKDFTSNKRTLPFYTYQEIIKEASGNRQKLNLVKNSGISQLSVSVGKAKGKDSGHSRVSLSEIKVISLYDNITDGVKYGRSLDDTVGLLRQTKTDFVFRGFFKWIWPVFDSPDKIPSDLIKASGADNLAVKQFAESIRSQGYYYENLERYISAIKESIPDLIFCGAIPAQCVGKLELNPMTRKVYTLNDAWKMSFDPQKWNLRHNGSLVTKEQFHKWFYGVHPYGGTTAENYDWRKAEAFLPDITDPDYQELIISWAQKQIDCGADAVWIDGLPQEGIFSFIFKEGTEILTKDLTAAAEKIVGAIHEYGAKKGKYIYVGYWADPFGLMKNFSNQAANVDFVTIAPSKEEVLNKKLDEAKWVKEVEFIRQVYGNIPILAFIDWSFDDSQLVAFSQILNKDEQSEALEAFDKAFENMGVKFVYPLHGGYMGRGAVTTKLSFGKDRIYDSLAPEFNTYETIRKLAEKKTGLNNECSN